MVRIVLALVATMGLLVGALGVVGCATRERTVVVEKERPVKEKVIVKERAPRRTIIKRR